MADSDGRFDGELVLEGRFAIVPEWVLDAEISDCALRLYAVLLRYGQSSGARMPGRATLARRLRKKSTDTVDRAMKELVGIGAVVVEHRYDGAQRLTNRYHVRTAPPSRTDAATPVDRPAGGRTGAATPGRTDRATPGRRDAAGVAAGMRHDREHLTERKTPPPPPRLARETSWDGQHGRLVEECGITDWPGFLAGVARRRREAGAAAGRWGEQPVLAALQLAVRGRGWPATAAPRALLSVAADPATRSPMRVAEAGPWWDEPAPPPSAGDPELAAIEEALDAQDGLRVLLQRDARAQLAAEGAPVTRRTVLRRAHELLLARQDRVAAC